MPEGPHADAQVLTTGAPLDEARAAVVALHGRGAMARSVLALANELDVPDVAWLGPQATGNTWYPYSFMADIANNEPHLSSALELVDETVERAVEAGIPRERVVLLGFSQGACVAADYVARNPTRYGGLGVLSGGLVGETLADDYAGDLDRTPVFLGCSEGDPWIPEDRVHDSAAVFASLNADVTTRIYDGDDHLVNDDEIDRLDAMVETLVADGG
jgi:phospholipase/carboxylesterase